MANRLQLTPRDALIIVDLQNDFCPGGALAVAGGDEIVPVFNRLIPRFATVATTRDWHPTGHCSFAAQGGIWPVHCVQESPGADFHPALQAGSAAIQVLKGTAPDRDNYSGFEGQPNLADSLRARGVERVVVGGLATDYCVKNTVLSALQAGFAAVALTDAMRAVNIKADDGDQALAAMAAAGAVLATSGDIED